MRDDGNVNSKEYWDTRFNTGDWENSGGSNQTQSFAKSQIPLLDIPSGFSGSLCDFGCGTGDAFPIYRQAYPYANLIGVDFSQGAIDKCNTMYSSLGDFFVADEHSTPSSDIILASNVFEHISDDESVLEVLLSKCQRLYVIVPFEEQPLISEHVRSYNLDSYKRFSPKRKVKFKTRGWSVYGRSLMWEVYAKNIWRQIAGLEKKKQKYQILYEFDGTR